MTHHGNEHVGQDDDDCDVIESEEKQPDPFNYRRGVNAAREARSVRAVVTFVRVLDLDLFDRNKTEHGPEQAVQRPWQPVTNDITSAPVMPASPASSCVMSMSSLFSFSKHSQL